VEGRFQSPEVLERWFVAISWSLFFIFFIFIFCNQMFIVSRYKKASGSVGHRENKTHRAQNLNKRKSRHQ